MSRKVAKGEILHERCGTPAYIAPEILRGDGYEGTAVDVWSAGIVLYAILYGNFPFNGDAIEDLELAILQGHYTLPSDISLEARDLLSRMLDPDAGGRIRVDEIYKHAWMASAGDSSKGGNEVVCLFSEEELDNIRRDYDFKERQRECSTSGDSSIFTVHNLDTETNEDEELSKSIVMAPYNTNESDEESFIETVEPLVVSRRVIKFSSKLREINREYERDNNSNIDNGIYVKPTAVVSSRIATKRDSLAKPSSNTNQRILSRMEEMGFDRKFVVGSINANSHNSATTCYYLLSER